MSIINSDISAAIKESKKDKPDMSKMTKRFKDAIITIKEVGDTINEVSDWNWTKRIAQILKLGPLIAL